MVTVGQLRHEGTDKGLGAMIDALTLEQIEGAVHHLRTFCTDKDWPRGEFNLPRARVTMKAFPEDEAVFTSTVNTENPGSVVNEVIYEQRFGAQNQFEIAVPFGWKERPNADGGENWRSGRGDVVFESASPGRVDCRQ